MPVPQGSGVIHRKSARQAVYETVCDWIITGVLEPGEKILDSDTQDIEKCYRPLADLEALAAELACGKLTENDFFELECALRDAKAASLREDAAAVMACDERFHERIVQAAGNEYVREFSRTLMLHIRRIKYHYFHLPAMREASAAQHMGIVEALRAENAPLARDRMREHWLRAMRGCLNETVAYLKKNEE